MNLLSCPLINALSSQRQQISPQIPIFDEDLQKNSFLLLKVYREYHTSQKREEVTNRGIKKDFPHSPMVKTPGFHCKRSRMPQDTEGGKNPSYELVLNYISYKLSLISI